MQTTTVNTAAGTVITDHAPYPQKKLMRYQLTLAILDGAHERREISDTDYAMAKDILAFRYYLEKTSILR